MVKNNFFEPTAAPLIFCVPDDIFGVIMKIEKTVPRQVARFFRDKSEDLQRWFGELFPTESRLVTFLVDAEGKSCFSLWLRHGNPPLSRSPINGALAGLSSSGKLRKIVAVITIGEHLLEGDDFAIVAPFVSEHCKVIGINGRLAISQLFSEQYKPLRFDSQASLVELRQVSPKTLPIFFRTIEPSVSLLSNQAFLDSLDDQARIIQQNGFSNGRDRPATKGHVAFAGAGNEFVVANNRRILTRRLCNCSEPGALQLLFSAKHRWADWLYLYSGDYDGTRLPVVCPQCLGHLDQAQRPGENLTIIVSNGEVRGRFSLEELLPHSYLKAERRE